MAAKYWIKLYHEILYDPKMARMPVQLWKRTVEMFLFAGEKDQKGFLPSVADMAWTLRTDEEQLETELIELQRIGILTMVQGCWFVSKFEERQQAMSKAEYMRRKREERQREEYYNPSLPPSYQSVTNGNVDKIRIDKEEDEEREEIPARSPAPPVNFPNQKPKRGIEALIYEATGQPIIPPSEYKYIEQIKTHVDIYGEEKVIEAYRNNYQKWVNTPRKNGPGNYSGTNFFWINWAQDELAGNGTHEKSWEEMNMEERKAYLLQGGKP